MINDTKIQEDNSLSACKNSEIYQCIQHFTDCCVLQYIFVTEVDSSQTKAVHDELARLLVLYFKMGQAKSEKLLQVLINWADPF